MTLSWRDLYVMVRWAQPESATYKEINPQWRANDVAQLLQSIEYSNRVMAWQRTKDGQRGRNKPEPWRWPWEEEEANPFKGDSVSWEEAEERWGRDMRARLEAA